MHYVQRDRENEKKSSSSAFTINFAHGHQHISLVNTPHVGIVVFYKLRTNNDLTSSVFLFSIYMTFLSGIMKVRQKMNTFVVFPLHGDDSRNCCFPLILTHLDNFLSSEKFSGKSILCCLVVPQANTLCSNKLAINLGEEK